MEVDALHQHISSQHHSDKKLEKEYRCKVCLLKFRGQTQLQRCMDRHEEALDLNGEVFCPVCNDTIRQEDQCHQTL